MAWHGMHALYFPRRMMQLKALLFPETTFADMVRASMPLLHHHSPSDATTLPACHYSILHAITIWCESWLHAILVYFMPY